MIQQYSRNHLVNIRKLDFSKTRRTHRSFGGLFQQRFIAYVSNSLADNRKTLARKWCYASPPPRRRKTKCNENVMRDSLFRRGFSVRNWVECMLVVVRDEKWDLPVDGETETSSQLFYNASEPLCKGAMTVAYDACCTLEQIDDNRRIIEKG